MLGFMNKKQERHAGDLIAALDIGAEKISCFIARVTESGGAHVIGIGHYASKGVRSGQFTDMGAVSNAVGHALHDAENMARETIQKVIVNVPALHCVSQMVTSETHVSGGEVTQNDIRRIMMRARDLEMPGQNQIIHVVPVSYCVDDVKGISYPLGMRGRSLKAQLHVVTAKEQVLQNIRQVLVGHNLEVEAFCADAYASALSTLIDDEKQLGCALVDMGAGMTRLSVFVEGALLHVDAIPVGGGHVTTDLARGLSTPIQNAERVKTLHGHAMQSTHDHKEMIDVVPISPDMDANDNAVSRSFVTSIIQPRMEEVLELVRSKLEVSGYSDLVGRRIIFTGGAAQLNGLNNLATLILDKQVRVASPKNVTGLAEVSSGPGFATCAGMLVYGLDHMEQSAQFLNSIITPKGVLRQVGYWLRENW